MNTKRNPNSLRNLRPPWRPGETGNPSGINRKRPYTDRLLDQAEALLPEETRTKINDAFQRQFGKKDMLPPGTTYADAEVLRIHLNVIMKGDINAAQFISDRIEGRPPNRLDLVGHERQEVTIRVVHDAATPKRRPDRAAVEASLFNNILEVIEGAEESEDENFLRKLAEVGQLIKQRARQKARTIDAPKIA
jgi:hypothetical protein